MHIAHAHMKHTAAQQPVRWLMLIGIILVNFLVSALYAYVRINYSRHELIGIGPMHISCRPSRLPDGDRKATGVSVVYAPHERRPERFPQDFHCYSLHHKYTVTFQQGGRVGAYCDCVEGSRGLLRPET